MGFRWLLFDDTGRIRSGWRFAIFVAAFIPVALLIGFVGVALLSRFAADLDPGSAGFLLTNGVLALTAALFVGWLCGKYLEGLPFRALGAWFTRRWLVHLLAGIVIGSLSFALAAGIGTVLGGLSFHPNTSSTASSIASTIAWTFVIFTAAAAFEEALFRGYILQTFIRSDLVLLAIVLTSTLFASVHNANPSASPLSWGNTFIAGVWFCVAYLKTRDLWMPLGLHLAWNWVQGAVFGVEVSGMTELAAHPLMREQDFGPAWITGGEYGIEGGIVTTIALIVSTAAIYFMPPFKVKSEE